MWTQENCVSLDSHSKKALRRGLKMKRLFVFLAATFLVVALAVAPRSTATAQIEETATPTETSTLTPTLTPTSTPTGTPVPTQCCYNNTNITIVSADTHEGFNPSDILICIGGVLFTLLFAIFALVVWMVSKQLSC